MEFRILGPLEVLAEHGPLPLGGPKQRALLAVLLVEANRVVSSDRLIDALWEEEPPETAAKALQLYVSQLRKLLGRERLETRAPGYLVRVGPDELDLARFRRLREEGLLEQALALWRGPPLGDLANVGFARAEVARLEELHLACVEERLDRDLARGRHAELAGELEALVRESPLRERLRGQLMLCLYRSGRQAEALAAYRAAREALVGDLGIEPGRELRELHQAILAQDPGLDLAAVSEPMAEPRRGAFVGRGRELAELVAGLDDAFAGRGRLFLLVGEPGIGKSRLAEELMADARARGARVLVGRCWEAGGAPAYWPWVQSLRAYVRDSATATLRSELGAGAAVLAQILPELREHFPGLPEPPLLDPEVARFHLFDTTTGFLRNASASRPIVLVLDDLHAADAPSLLLLRFLARQLGSARMLLVGAYRDVDPIPGQPLTEMQAELAREPMTRRLWLGGLSEHELAEYVELTASEIVSPELVAALHEETEGNPLFVGEMVRLLSVEGVGSESTAEVRLAIPQTVRDVIARRLTHLSEECNRVLVLASVLGREFALDALARMAGRLENSLLEVLDEAMAARVVSEVPGAPGRLRFSHVLIRDTLYEGLTPAGRVRLHRLAADALEALYGHEPGPHLAELSHHAIAGRDFARGVRFAKRAGDRALSLLAYEEAARLYETALDALDLADLRDEGIRCELLLSLGEAEIRAGNSPTAKKAFRDAAIMARRLSLPRELARAAAGYGGRVVWARAGDDDRLVPLLEEALTALADDDVELRARLLARLAGALRDEHPRARRGALSREAVELARRTGNPAALAYALDGRAAAISAPDTVAECLALSSELRDVAERIGDTEHVLAGYFHRFIAQVTLGDTRRATADLEAMIRIANELRQPAQLWQVRSLQAMMALATGGLAEAEALAAQALALGEHAVAEIAIPVYRLQRYTLFEFHGTLDEVEPVVRNLAAEYPARTVFRCALAHVYAVLGRADDARGEFEKLAQDGFSCLPFDLEWLYGMSLLAETCAALGDTDSADVLHRMLVPFAAFNAADVPEGIRGSVSRYLGILASTTTRWEQAERHFEDALETNARMAARPWVAHTEHDYAHMLLRRDKPGDRARGTALISAALATYRELGMQTWAEKASSLQETLRELRPLRK